MLSSLRSISLQVLFLLEESGAGKRVVKSLNYKMTTDGGESSCFVVFECCARVNIRISAHVHVLPHARTTNRV